MPRETRIARVTVSDDRCDVNVITPGPGVQASARLRIGDRGTAGERRREVRA
jgi:hypothetical protein